MKKLLRSIGAVLLATALVVSLIPTSDVEAASTSDFQVTGNKLMRYSGTSEIVSIPDDVLYIAEEAFAGNDYIVKVNVGDKVKAIGYGAFQDCKGLRTVTIGNNCEEIGQGAFSKDPALETVSFGTNVKKVGSALFAGDTSFKKLENSSPYLKVENDVLYNFDQTKIFCMLPSYKNGEYTMPRTVEEILGYSFWGNENIKNVSLSSNLAYIPEYAFSNCPNIKQVEIPLTVHSIDAKAFEDCVNLSLVKIPESVSNIHPTAFDGCPKVTISATAGTYAAKYAQELIKSEVSEMEYEDVGQSATVDENAANFVQSDSVTHMMPVSGDTSTMEVKNGQPEDDNPEATHKPTPTPKPARYKDGVINGTDVVSYEYYDPSTDPQGPLLGSSSIVGGRALIFIDNKTSVKNGASGLDLSKSETDSVAVYDENGKMIGNAVTNADGSVTMISADSPKDESDKEKDNTDSETESDSSVETEDGTSLSNVLADNAKKGRDFPKFTVAGEAIATQAYYQDDSLDDFEFPEDVTKISDFAFARSSLSKIDIPEGVTSIGYGAFYHCDNLEDVTIPSTVTSIGEYAFAETPFLNNTNDKFVIAGDGVLISYNGNDSVVTIPEGVKLIANGAFKDHNGITAVNLADSLLIIGEDAFNGCSNLKTLNRGDNVTDIGANAFKGTALSNVTLSPNVKSVGIGAFDLKNGTDTVTVLGTELPVLTDGIAANRLANTEDRTYAFGNMKKAIINPNIKDLKDTVLEPGKYGFCGTVVDVYGNTVSDNTVGVCNLSNQGVLLDVNSSVLTVGPGAGAKIPGDEGNYVLHIQDSQNAKEKIDIAYGDLYGGKSPENLIGLDISLKDATDTIEIKKLGRQSVTVTLPLPESLNTDNLHMVSLDGDGQLEAVDFVISDSDDGKMISFTCNHFSPYGFYNYAGSNRAVEKEGSHIKDITPDTGDDSIHPKWFLVIGCIATAIVLFLISMKETVEGLDDKQNKKG